MVIGPHLAFKTSHSETAYPIFISMKRRSFIQSLAAVFSLPANAALTLQPAAALPSAAAVPVKARFWAVYLSGLHGDCPPRSLQSALRISESDAKTYLSRLIADGVIKPNPISHAAASKVLNGNEENLASKAHAQLENKTRPPSGDTEILESANPKEEPGGTLELAQDNAQLVEELEPLDPQNPDSGDTDASERGSAGSYSPSG